MKPEKSDFETMSIEQIALAIEADAGMSLPGLRESLAQAKSGEYGRIHTPESILARRKAGRPVGSVAASRKTPVTLRVDPEVLERWRASGKGWQTRAAEVLAKAAPA